MKQTNQSRLRKNTKFSSFWIIRCYITWSELRLRRIVWQQELENLASVLKVINLQGRLDATAEQYWVDALVFEVLLRKKPHKIVIPLLGLVPGPVPNPQEVFVADIETHRPFMPLGKLIETVEFQIGYFGLDEFNNVSAASRTQVINELSWEVGNDVSDVFLLLSSVNFDPTNRLPVHKGFLGLWCRLGYCR